MGTRLQPGDRIYVRVKTTGGYVGEATVVQQLAQLRAVQFLLDYPEFELCQWGLYGNYYRIRMVRQKVVSLERVEVLADSEMPAEHREYIETLCQMRGPARILRCNLRMRWSRRRSLRVLPKVVPEKAG